MQRGGTGSRGRWSDDRDLEGEREAFLYACVAMRVQVRG